MELLRLAARLTFGQALVLLRGRTEFVVDGTRIESPHTAANEEDLACAARTQVHAYGQCNADFELTLDNAQQSLTSSLSAPVTTCGAAVADVWYNRNSSVAGERRSRTAPDDGSNPAREAVADAWRHYHLAVAEAERTRCRPN
ncbi:MAG: hypothetical protein KDA79_23765 [Planctomycetaceae bacterium]|nr:hypothetical protein [Planctomycetaceae bacterium]